MQWDDLWVFFAVAQGGRLRKAARVLRLGLPTIGRHLLQLISTPISIGARHIFSFSTVSPRAGSWSGSDSAR